MNALSAENAEISKVPYVPTGGLGQKQWSKVGDIKNDDHDADVMKLEQSSPVYCMQIAAVSADE